MQVLVNTDRNVEATPGLVQAVEGEVSSALSRVSDQVTRVDVHLGDENSNKFGTADKRCMMEARPAGHEPIAVTHHGASLHEAYSGAAEKLKHLLEGRLDQMRSKKGGDSIRYQGPPEDLAPLPNPDA